MNQVLRMCAFCGIMFLCLAECYIQLSADGAAIIVERRGGKVAVVKYSDGSWQLQVDDL